MVTGLGELVEAMWLADQTAAKSRIHAIRTPQKPFRRDVSMDGNMGNVFANAAAHIIEENILASPQIRNIPENAATLTKRLLGSVIKKAMQTAQQMGISQREISSEWLASP